MFTIKILKKSAMITIALFYVFVVVLSSCRKDEELIIAPSFEGFVVPAHFPAPVYDFKNNKVTKAGFELGRELFYDPILSRDNSVSCGTCHKQYSAFADYQHNFSHGIDNQFTLRNSPGLFNLAWNSSFMADGGINHIELIPVAPITNPLEMDESLKNVMAKLRNHSSYPKRFREAFGVDSITSKELLLAFAQFMGMMVSANSPYDRYMLKKAELTYDELEGMKLFESKCGGCHQGVLQTDHSFRNNGLDDDFSKDKGRFLITGNAEDEGKFRVPSLRNVYITPPYMHDGRMETLEEVLEHYRTSVKNSPTLDPLLNNGIAMTDKEKDQIIAFLKTLTDTEFTKSEKFKEPKK